MFKSPIAELHFRSLGCWQAKAVAVDPTRIAQQVTELPTAVPCMRCMDSDQDLNRNIMEINNNTSLPALTAFRQLTHIFLVTYKHIGTRREKILSRDYCGPHH